MAVATLLFDRLLMAEGIEIKVWHQVGLYIFHCLAQCFYELVKIFFVQKDLVPVVPIIIKSFTTLCNGQIVIVPFGGTHIKKVGSSLAGPDSFTVDTVLFSFVVLVRHKNNFKQLVNNRLTLYK